MSSKKRRKWVKRNQISLSSTQYTLLISLFNLKIITYIFKIFLMPTSILNKYRPTFRYFTKLIFISFHVSVNITIYTVNLHCKYMIYISQVNIWYISVKCTKVIMIVKANETINIKTHTNIESDFCMHSSSVFLSESMLNSSLDLNSRKSNVTLWLIHLLLEPSFWSSAVRAWIKANHLHDERKPTMKDRNNGYVNSTSCQAAKAQVNVKFNIYILMDLLMYKVLY